MRMAPKPRRWTVEAVAAGGAEGEGAGGGNGRAAGRHAPPGSRGRAHAATRPAHWCSCPARDRTPGAGCRMAARWTTSSCGPSWPWACSSAEVLTLSLVALMFSAAALAALALARRRRRRAAAAARFRGGVGRAAGRRPPGRPPPPGGALRCPTAPTRRSRPSPPSSASRCARARRRCASTASCGAPGRWPRRRAAARHPGLHHRRLRRHRARAALRPDPRPAPPARRAGAADGSRPAISWSSSWSSLLLSDREDRAAGARARRRAARSLQPLAASPG